MTRRSRTVQVQAEKQPGCNSSSVCTLSRLVSSSARRTSAPDVTRQLQASSGSDGAHSSWPRSVRRRSNGRPPLPQATDQGRSRGGCRERRERAGLGQDAVRPTPQAARNRLGVSQGQKTCWYGVVLRDLEWSCVWAWASELHECHRRGARGESPPESFEQALVCGSMTTSPSDGQRRRGRVQAAKLRHSSSATSPGP